MEQSDRIERSIIINASLGRVWQAISNAEEFGNWFGVNLKGQNFVAGQRTQGNITYPGYEHVLLNVIVENVTPQRLLSFRWHPAAIDQSIDYSQEPMTLVEFQLSEVAGGVLVKVIESGFDQIPELRRALAFRMNSGGWDAQMQNIAKHLAKSA